MQKFVRFISILLMICAYAHILFAQCEIAPSPGAPSKTWDEIFTQNGPGKGLEPAGSPGWTGADSTYSILLPNGDSAFLFSDSYIGEWPPLTGDGTVSVDKNGLRTTAINCKPPICDPEASSFFARNSVVLLSKDRKSLKTLVGPKNKLGFSTSYFPMDENDRYYWVGDGGVVRFGGKSTVIVFLHRFDGKLAYHGSTVAQLNAQTLAIEKMKELGNDGDPATHWGSAIMLDGKNLYIYGKRYINGKKQAMVAKADTSGGFDVMTNTANWTVWNGKAWVTGLGNEAAITPAADSTSDEYSVAKFKVNGRDTYIMVGLDTLRPFGEWRDIVLYSSCLPQGPFTGKHKIYTAPETTADSLPGFAPGKKLSGRLIMYNPHIHPQFSGNGKLLVSYNLNRQHNSDSIFIDGYRPRFIEVGVKGLK
jgi:hypothetical protein